MADRRDRLAGRVKLLHEFARQHLHAQLVGVQRASGEKHRIEFLGVRIFESHIDREALVLLVVFHALDLGLRRDEHRIGASLLERQTRKRELHLLDAVHREDRHTHALED